MTIPIKAIEGVELVSTNRTSVCSVRVVDANAQFSLSWDRYVRLKAAAESIRKVVDREKTIIDVGGYDGALALFLPEYSIDLIDPATTGASLLHEPVADHGYDIVAAIDVLEHVNPADRVGFLSELSRVAREYIVLNYPCRESTKAQKLVLEATNNKLIREHVEWDLPDSDWVIESMSSLGFESQLLAHGSLAVWLGQYLTLNLAPEAAATLNRYLISHHSDEPFSTPLYHLVACKRRA